MIDPFVALMRRYAIDYTSSHDVTVCDAIMEPEYVVHIAGMSLPRDAAYKPAVEFVFAQFPGLCLAIHEIITNGERLAMRFSEHAADAEGRLCSWAGIALYRWNGSKLTECRVEQDFLSRQRQLTSGVADALEPPHHDPWTTTRPAARSLAAERTVGGWLATGRFGSADAGAIDDVGVGEFRPTIEPSEVEVLDLFSAGPRVAFHATARGRYCGGLPDAEEHLGREAELRLTGIADVDGERIARVKIVTDRLGAWSRLTGRAMF
jgi:SnoaL-like polyketide cyclase